jgi:hypothetical protein
MSSPVDDLAILGAVVFRRKIIEEDAVARLSPDVKASCRDAMLSLFTPDRSVNFLKRLADCILHLAIAEAFEGELLNYINNWVVSPSPNLRETSMYIFELATQYVSLKKLLTGNL